MADDYEWDVFISYRRSEPVNSWVHQHFARLLREWLLQSMPPQHQPRVFLDDEGTETGEDWPRSLQDALQHSRILVPILSPDYCRSEWCMAEFLTMRERERHCGLREDDDPHGRLIYPVLFSDGDHLPDYMRVMQRKDMRQWSVSIPRFDETPIYLDFYQAMKEAAEEVGQLALTAPDWDSEWPLLPTPDVSVPPPIKLPRL